VPDLALAAGLDPDGIAIVPDENPLTTISTSAERR
jgi:hypothetical protein